MAALRDPYVVHTVLLCLAAVLLAGALFGMAVGAGLIFRSALMMRVFRVMNRWVSTRRLLKPLEIPRAATGPVSSSLGRRLAGIVFALGGGYAVLVLSRIDVVQFVSVIGRRANLTQIALVLLDALRWLLVVGGAAAIAVSVLLVFFPRILASVEARANRWYSTRQLVAGGDAMHLTLDRWVERFPRASGAIVIALSVIPAVASAILLFGRQ